ncbi:MAG: hypothetical protein AB1391_04690 [Candidatus Micrarchaeota archaeon]
MEVTSDHSELTSALTNLNANIPNIMLIALIIQFVFVLISFGFWYWIRKREDLNWIHKLVVVILTFLCAGFIGIILAAIAAVGFEIIIKKRDLSKKEDFSAFTKTFALVGAVLGVVFLLIGVILLSLAPTIIKSLYST